MKTLAELRTSPNVGLPQTDYALCLAGKLNRTIAILGVELNELEARLAKIPAPDPDAPRKPTTMLDVDPRTELDEEIAAKRAEYDVAVEGMEEELSPVLLTAKDGGKWEEWVEANPAREDNELDMRVGFNLRALQAVLHEHIVTISEQPLVPGDWEFIVENAAPGDLRQMALTVWRLQTGSVRVPKSLTPSKVAPESDSSD